jgi:hypothetical protein
MRVYIPATMRALAAWLVDGTATSASGLPAHAVTADRQASLPISTTARPAEQLEELEYEATLAAAQESTQLLGHQPAAPRRRVVLAADVPDAAVRPDPARGPSAVRVYGAVPLAWVAAAHCDDDDIDPSADPEELAARPLSWYATQELAGLVADLGLAHPGPDVPGSAATPGRSR